jgi:transaldolase
MTNFSEQKKNQLQQLKTMTTVVADTGDFASIAAFSPQDTTTNPSLLLKAAAIPRYEPLILDAIFFGKAKGSNVKEKLSHSLDKLLTNFGKEILSIIPGRVSIEIDAKLSFDTEKSIKKARNIISLFEESGISKKRILIKLASTWEGIQAAKVLEKEKIHCNMTLLFSLYQAVACADVNATLISPFVGRILDWHKKQENRDFFPPHEDPGVLSVKKIFNYYKKFGYPTEVMGASFRSKEEIVELAGCDLLTISPSLLDELKNSQEPLTKKLDNEKAKFLPIEKIELDENLFRLHMNDDPMATEKLAEGIRLFIKDQEKLEDLLKKDL